MGYTLKDLLDLCLDEALALLPVSLAQALEIVRCGTCHTCCASQEHHLDDFEARTSERERGESGPGCCAGNQMGVAQTKLWEEHKDGWGGGSWGGGGVEMVGVGVRVMLEGVEDEGVVEAYDANEEVYTVHFDNAGSYRVSRDRSTLRAHTHTLSVSLSHPLPPSRLHRTHSLTVQHTLNS
jgi:hypothetical protein